MAKTLVIVESPTKAKTIAKFLGTDFQVESSFGHVRDLPSSNMGIDIEGGTFEPTYRVQPKKTPQVKKLKELAEKCNQQIIFATDEDREGEAIAWHLAYLLKVKPSEAKRIVFHEITKHAIEHALASPRHIDQKLVDAQQARRVLDRLVGYELSPFLWKKVARGLSAGRVQSVAVRLIVERERERNAFVSQEYWSIDGLFAKDDHQFLAHLIKIDDNKVQKLDVKDKEQVDTILSALSGAAYQITTIESKEGTRTPPPPLRTSTLQQRANQLYGFSSKQTMRLAQQLYEVGRITYMRTDSTNLSQKFLSEAHAYIGSAFGEKYQLPKARVYASKAKGAQEAHEAIRPTDPSVTPESIQSGLDPQQQKLYALIWKSAVATQMAAAKLQKTAVDIASKTSPQYLFRANGQTVMFDGWMRLYPNLLKEEMLPVLKEGEAIPCVELKPEQHFTQPPARYSDATLVKTMEEYGIGRPSTYAPTIATIEAREYVQRDEQKRFQPLDVANIVNDLLVEHFSEIVDYRFTAVMEENLDAIAEGKKDWQPIIATFYHPFHENIVKKTEEISREDVSQQRELGIDPKTGKPIYARLGRFGPFVQLGSKEDEEKPRFASLKEGQLLQTVTLDDALVLLSLPRTLGTLDGQDIKANIGRFGSYIQVGKEYFSLKGTEKDPYTVTEEEACAVIAAGREQKAQKTIQVFEGADIKILRGPYGPYITDGKKNARIPKDMEHPEALTLEECQEMLKNAKPGRSRGGRSRKKTQNPRP